MKNDLEQVGDSEVETIAKAGYQLHPAQSA
jgi:DNA-binding winged helix-turn-helix (wHTH) protein